MVFDGIVTEITYETRKRRKRKIATRVVICPRTSEPKRQNTGMEIFCSASPLLGAIFAEREIKSYFVSMMQGTVNMVVCKKSIAAMCNNCEGYERYATNRQTYCGHGDKIRARSSKNEATGGIVLGTSEMTLTNA